MMQAHKLHTAALKKIKSFWWLSQRECSFLSSCDKLQSTTKTLSLCHTFTQTQQDREQSVHPNILSHLHRHTEQPWALSCYVKSSQNISLFFPCCTLSPTFLSWFGCGHCCVRFFRALSHSKVPSGQLNHGNHIRAQVFMPAEWDAASWQRCMSHKARLTRSSPPPARIQTLHTSTTADLRLGTKYTYLCVRCPSSLSAAACFHRSGFFYFWCPYLLLSSYISTRWSGLIVTISAFNSLRKSPQV